MNGWFGPHIVWPLRKLRNRMQARWRQWRTGVPGWIVELGEVTACPHGYTHVSNWTLDFTFADWSQPIVMDEFVDRLVLAAPDCVVHAPLPAQCTFCDHQETFA